MNPEDTVPALWGGDYIIFDPRSSWYEVGPEWVYCSDCNRNVKVGLFRYARGEKISQDFAPVMVRKHGRTFYLVAWCDCQTSPVAPFRPPSEESGGG
jgi:hypothetical protein